MESYSNELIHENSLYLQQHAHNPVNWVSWSESVFERAKKEDKLIVISIGYSSCHWCHVMEHESFEDEEVAAIMNKHFLCVKVDREERPDIDQVYMTAVQLMTQRGGWPLNCITLPDGKPIYGGTYFPKEQWIHILKSLVHTFTHERLKTEEYADQLHKGILQVENIVEFHENSSFSEDKLHELVINWKSRMDITEGGSGAAPKFPLPNNLEFLWWYSKVYNDLELADFVELSLTKMALGGIYDQVGGGFSRYSVDSAWKIPHFEKMLYDNGQLLALYALGYSESNKKEYSRIIQQAVNWILREMKDSNGGLFASQDADSEGEEGKYYCWTEAEIDAILTENAYKFKSLYLPQNKAYWEDNKWVLQRNETWEEWLNRNTDKTGFWIEEQLKKLMEFRVKRIAPTIDTKIICSWNAMAVVGLLTAYQHTSNPIYYSVAQQTLSFIKSNLIEDNKVFRVRNSKIEIEGFLDDYACAIQALILNFQLNGNQEDLDLAGRLSDHVFSTFSCENSALFYYSSQRELISRSIEINDNVMPSSNSIMAHNLLNLSLLLEKPAFENQALSMLSSVYDGMENYGSGYSNWALLLLRHLQGMILLTLPKTEEWEELRLLASPLVVVHFSDEAYAIVCKGKSCSLPLTSVNEVRNYLEEIINGRKKYN